MDCKATVCLGEFSRGGKSRGETQAMDHDMGSKTKYIPFGIVDEEQGELFIEFGSSCKTSDFIMDALEHRFSQLPEQEKGEIPYLQIKVDNGPESSGVRTQFLSRMVDWVDRIGIPVQLLYFPPYHSKYNPIERCWGILELHWNGALLTDEETMLAWARSMTWKGRHPSVELNTSSYDRGVSLSKKEMRPIEKRLLRHPNLPKWDILISPLSSWDLCS